MAQHVGDDDETVVSSGMSRTAVTSVGTGLIVFGSGLLSFLLSQGWSWLIGILAFLLIIEGIDCLFAGITGRNGASPILLAWWPTL